MFVFNALLCYMFLCTKVGPVELPEWMGVPEEPPADPTLTIIFGAVIFTWSAPYMPRERSTHTNHAHKPRTQTSHTGLINRHAQDHAARAHTHTHTHTHNRLSLLFGRDIFNFIYPRCAPPCRRARDSMRQRLARKAPAKMYGPPEVVRNFFFFDVI